MKALYQIIAIFGVPAQVTTDRGTTFRSNRFKEFCTEYGIKHILNAIAILRANGQCERLNRTVLSSLATTCPSEPDNRWDEKVKVFQSAINSDVNRSIRMCPTQILLGYIPRSSANARLQFELQDNLDQLNLAELRRAAKNAIETEQSSQKRNYDARRFQASMYAVSDVVMVSSNPPATGESKKLVAKAEGPFKVTVVSPNNR